MILFPTGITLTIEEEICLKHDLVDIEQWVNEALQGKLDNCKKRLSIEAEKHFKSDPTTTSIPTDVNVLISNYISLPIYKNRSQRDAETE